ncbi:MAG TPA: NlpC/P60 family protein [Bryobacteraceae bacterium]|nr:NlpC/P60 family protein [Bryobacteraceae bacterium]
MAVARRGGAGVILEKERNWYGMPIVMAMALLAAGAADGVILKPVANMYSRPSEEADVVSQAIYASHIGILEERSGWARVRTIDEYTGWMQAADFKRQEPGGRAYGSSGRVAQVNSLFANVYREASVTRHQPLLTVPFGTTLEGTQEVDAAERWIEVRLPDDRRAWVLRGDINLDPKPMSLEEVIALSKRFLGLPYFWGGTSSFGFDCSGFTQMLCRRRGIGIPRDASLQAKWAGAAPVERNDLQAGDLLFFGESKITHTGMYIGGGKFINATTHDRPAVQISDLADPYWTKRFIAARRLK